MTKKAGALALLTCAEMARADAAAVAAGIASRDLMAVAGAAVVREIVKRFSPVPTVVLCGRGNNGGDGFVVARALAEAGWPVRVALLDGVGPLSADAAYHADLWTGPVERLGDGTLDSAALVVDALFGAGLARPLDGVARAVVEAVGERRLPCVAVDLPSGVNGDTGAVLGAAPCCRLTVTFFRRKPAHVLLPARDLCGETVVADIGIPDAALTAIAPRAHYNGPDLWLARFPWAQAQGHKYARGHAVVVGGAAMTGAARLAARAAMRVGAGLVTVASEPHALPIYALDLAALLTAPLDGPDAFDTLISDRRRNAILLGPGNGASPETRTRVLAALAAEKSCVLDADALSACAGDPSTLFAAIRTPCVLTPHEGEFARLFADMARTHPHDKIARARGAARASGAVVLLKGYDTVIAAPDGQVAINVNAPAELATAGAGDVLAGLIVGLLAQGMAPFDAACAAAWIHGDAASMVGPGLIADDLPANIPAVLRCLRAIASADGAARIEPHA